MSVTRIKNNGPRGESPSLPGERTKATSHCITMANSAQVGVQDSTQAVKKVKEKKHE